MTTPTPTTKATVGIGPTTIVGWIVGFAGLLPSLVAAFEGSAGALHGNEKVSAIAGLAVLVVTQIGRYVQSLKL